MSHTVRPTPGWYADPEDSQLLRWWSGAEWSDHTQPVPGGGVLTAERVEQKSDHDEISVHTHLPEPESTTQDPVAMSADDEPPVSPSPKAVPRPGRTKRILLVLLIVFALVGVAAGAGWYFWVRPSSTGASAQVTTPDPAQPAPAAPAVPADAPVPGACADVVSALTADGTSSQLATQLQSVAAGGDLGETASFFASIGPVAADLLANSGAACVAAVNNGQGPAAYATFVNAFQAAMTTGTETVNAGLAQPGGLTPEQKAELTKQAGELNAATAAVVKDAPIAPVGPPAG